VPTHAIAAPLETEPRPEFLEMVGRLAGAYCPPLLPTDVVEVARAALVGRAADEIGDVEAVARVALEAAVASSRDRTAPEDLRP
jgi:hypothetical protein